MEFELSNIVKYLHWMNEPMWTILNDPDTHDCEDTGFAHYYTSDLFARTPYGIAVVTAGRRVDGASIPWLFQWLIPKSGKWNRPSAFHDVGYQDGGLWILQTDGTLKFQKLSKYQIDEVYLYLMKHREVAKWNRNTQYCALRGFGWYTWNKYRKADKKKSIDKKT